jgi:penicillin amidase
VRRIGRLFLGLLLVVIVAAGGGLLWLRSSLPVTDGRLTLAGPTAEIRITRDVNGVPTVRAANDHDAAFALGYLHAQERLFQMDMMRRLGAGRLSEVLGPMTLSYDRQMRTLGIYAAAERELAGLPKSVTDTLDAYAAGVNAYIEHRSGALPPEYYLLRFRPEPWHAADSAVWGKLMDMQLAGNFHGELLRARLLQRLPPEALSVLFPSYPPDAPVTLSDAALFQGLPLDRLAAALPPLAVSPYASNNWVVDGAHSASGKPLLANDPHLDFSAPSVWYLARIVTPSLTLAGVTTPGVPFVVIGHNERIAWGFTTTNGDVEDIYVEKLDPDHAERYLTPDGSQPFSTHIEEIKVRGGATVSLTVRATRHGPVISDLAQFPAQAGEVLVLKATWLMDDDRTPQAALEMAHAQDWSQFRRALANWTAPQQNIVYADVDGHIGFVAPARIPIRAKGDGWLPVPGWTDDYEWTGFVPDAALPADFDPPQGRFVSANNKIVPDNFPYFISRDWELPNRAQRINELLDAAPQQSPASYAAIQHDDLSIMARQLVPLMTAGAHPDSPRAIDAVQRLSAWDFRMDAGAVEPLVFVTWLRAFGTKVLGDRLGPLFDDYYWNLHSATIVSILTEHRDWCSRPAVAKADAAATDARSADACGERLTETLDSALADLAQRYGDDMKNWRWGAAHQAVFDSRIWSRVPVLSALIDRRIPADGGPDTVNAAAFRLNNPEPVYDDVHGPSLRMIVDMAQPDGAQFMISPGQSGDPQSPHFGDLMQRWRDGRYLAVTDDASGGTLVLAPP